MMSDKMTYNEFFAEADKMPLHITMEGEEIARLKKRVAELEQAQSRLLGQLESCVAYLNRAHNRDKQGGYLPAIESANKAIYQKGRVTPVSGAENGGARKRKWRSLEVTP